MENQNQILIKSTKTDIAYIAGLFDGEGCIVLRSRVTNPRSKRKNHRLYISITNSNKKAVNFVKSRFGGKILLRKSISRKQFRKDGTLCKNSYSWRISGNLNSYTAYKFLELIFLHSIIKKDEIKVAIKFCRTFSPEFKSERKRWGRFGVPLNIFNLRESLCSKIKQLKRRN